MATCDECGSKNGHKFWCSLNKDIAREMNLLNTIKFKKIKCRKCGTTDMLGGTGTFCYDCAKKLGLVF